MLLERMPEVLPAKNANARPAGGMKQRPPKTMFQRTQVPSFCKGNIKGDKNMYTHTIHTLHIHIQLQ